MLNLAKMPRKFFLDVVREAPSAFRMAAADSQDLVECSQYIMQGCDDADAFHLIALAKNILELANIPFEIKRED